MLSKVILLNVILCPITCCMQESRKMFWENQQVLNDGEVDEIVNLATKAYYDSDHASGYFLRGKKDPELIQVERRSLNPGVIPEFVIRKDQSITAPYVIEVKRGADSGRISPTQRRYITDHLSSFVPSG